MYLTQDSTGTVGVFNNPQDGYTASTQPEIDVYDLDQAKADKIVELDDDLSAYEKAGYTYTGTIVCAAWGSGTTYAKKDQVLATDGKNYKSRKDDNTNHEPPNGVWWTEYEPVFKTLDRVTTNIILKNALPAATPDRWIFGAKGNIPIDFGNVTNWDAFYDAILPEKDRIMRKYDNYLDQIDLCTTVAQVDAITPDFAP